MHPSSQACRTAFYIPISPLYNTPSPRPLSPDTVARAVKAMLTLLLANTVGEEKKSSVNLILVVSSKTWNTGK
jgi:hypothetical protein